MGDNQKQKLIQKLVKVGMCWFKKSGVLRGQYMQIELHFMIFLLLNLDKTWMF